MIASGIPKDIVQEAYDFAKDALVGSDREDWERAFKLAMAAYVAGARCIAEIGTKEERIP